MAFKIIESVTRHRGLRAQIKSTGHNEGGVPLGFKKRKGEFLEVRGLLDGIGRISFPFYKSG